MSDAKARGLLKHPRSGFPPTQEQRGKMLLDYMQFRPFSFCLFEVRGGKGTEDSRQRDTICTSCLAMRLGWGR